ncbi:hypothetical protein SteCoe_33583 [Stentor coeruleus]|uniref:Uncharacterized protein n=1 Tax=Stentor coeruleus TaxID=5963 RepID=A0A1R2AWE6_9CILI|nr:hypothetical protein SteCoe_33583 [Stentor coeruleus]
MERHFDLREQTYKELLILLNTTEEMLFSYPVSNDLRSKYEQLRSETFNILRLKITPLPNPQKSSNNKSQELDAKKNKLPSKTSTQTISNLFSTLHKSIILIENYQEELEFKILTMKSIFNTIAEQSNIQERLESKPEWGEKSEFHDESTTQRIDPDYESSLERIKFIMDHKEEKLKKIKQELIRSEGKIFEILKNPQLNSKNVENIFHKKYMDEIVSLKNSTIKYEDKIKEMTQEINSLKQESVNEKISTNKKITEMLTEIHQLQEKSPRKTEEIQGKVDESIVLKDRVLSLELALAGSEKNSQETTNFISSTQEKCNKLVRMNEELEEKLRNTMDDYQELEKNLEQERYFYEVLHTNTQKKLVDQENTLKEAHEDYVLSIKNEHKKQITTMKIEFNEEIMRYQEEIEALHAEIDEISDSNDKIIKSLQLDLLKNKEISDNKSLINKSNEKINDQLEETQIVIRQLEESLTRSQNTLSYLQDLFFPPYEAYSTSQKDWIEDEYIKRLNKNHYEGIDIIIAAEFTIFYLKKNIRDKQWLVDKLEEATSMQRLSKTSLDTFSSQNNYRDESFLKQIWVDIKNTSVTMKNFEKSREMLISQFGERKGVSGVDLDDQWSLKRK